MMGSITFNGAFFSKFIKFGVVGGTGVVVDFFFTWLFKEKFNVHKYVANALGFCIAATTNWYLNRIWTFHSQNAEVLREFVDFFVISLIGLAINSMVLWFITDRLKVNFYISKLGAIAVTTVWNFFANYIYTFAQ